ncbi:hypothetical protein PAPHI01_0437 [Pancytospora philotis]|nr:hypothetical protein PAPHI01_0437 [Pancytospora philotis]
MSSGADKDRNSGGEHAEGSTKASAGTNSSAGAADCETNPLLTLEKNNTINDMEQSQVTDYFNSFLKQHGEIIDRNLGSSAFYELKGGLFSFLRRSSDEIKIPEERTAQTEISYSTKPFSAPADLDYLIKIFFKMDLGVSGIFRVNSTSERIENTIKLLNDVIAGKLSLEADYSTFTDNFDIIDIAETYKYILRNMETSVVPSRFLPMAKKINTIADPVYKRVCACFWVYALPAMNRRVLELNSRFATLFIEEIEKRVASGKPTQLNMSGLSRIMMPCLMCVGGQDIAIEDVMALAEFTNYLLTNFRALVTI